MNAKEIAAELLRLDKAWEDTPAPNYDQTGVIQLRIARVVADNLKIIIAKLES